MAQISSSYLDGGLYRGGRPTVCHDNHEHQHSYEDRGCKKARMEVREPIRYIDEFNHGKGKDHGLTPPISALSSSFELLHLA